MENKPDKGMKDGSCNVTACQAPLAGTMQGWMVNHTVTNGRLYYCQRCCRRFNELDDRLIQAGQEKARRITWDETTGPRIAGIHEDHDVGPEPTEADVFNRSVQAKAAAGDPAALALIAAFSPTNN